VAINLQRHEYFKLAGDFDEYAKGQTGLVICLVINRSRAMKNFVSRFPAGHRYYNHASVWGLIQHQSSALPSGQDRWTPRTW